MLAQQCSPFGGNDTLCSVGVAWDDQCFGFVLQLLSELRAEKSLKLVKEYIRDPSFGVHENARARPTHCFSESDNGATETVQRSLCVEWRGRDQTWSVLWHNKVRTRLWRRIPSLSLRPFRRVGCHALVGSKKHERDSA